MVFISVFFISIPALCGAEDQDLLYYEDLDQQLRDQFDQAPLISKSLTKSDWCRVIT